MRRMPQNSNKVMDWMTLSGYRLPPGTHAGAVAAAVAANAANASAAAAAAASTAAAAGATKPELSRSNSAMSDHGNGGGGGGSGGGGPQPPPETPSPELWSGGIGSAGMNLSCVLNLNFKKIASPFLMSKLYVQTLQRRHRSITIAIPAGPKSGENPGNRSATSTAPGSSAGISSQGSIKGRAQTLSNWGCILNS